MTAPRAAQSPQIVSLEAPRWALDLVPEHAEARQQQVGGMLLRSSESSGYSLVEVRVPDAVSLAPKAFEEACTKGYELIFEQLEKRRAGHPIRLWNFIPSILAPLGQQPHRYMHFNFGRYTAFNQRYGGQGFVESIATASGVGHDADELILVCLAAEQRGEPVENPRQIASYFYSNRYGLLPPCFARATRFCAKGGEAPLLMVGGTASVCGEDSVHLEDLVAQIEETLLNLAMVVRAAEEPEAQILEPIDRAVGELLDRYLNLRVYYVEPRHLDTVRELVKQRVPPQVEVEYLRADLCRPELLVEIEGLAQLRRFNRR